MWVSFTTESYVKDEKFLMDGIYFLGAFWTKVRLNQKFQEKEEGMELFFVLEIQLSR